MMENQLNCHYCGKSLKLTDYFCPNCGKKLKDKPLSATIPRQIFIYLLSLLLPPLGLWPGIKYLRQKDEKLRMIGLAAVILTVISTVITVWITLGFVNTFNQQLNSSLNLLY